MVGGLGSVSHAKRHLVSSLKDHKPVPGAVLDHIVTFNANGLPVKDSGVTIAALIGGLIYKGTWDASLNIPALSDATGTQGWYYATSVAGTQNLGSGPISFLVGDWVLHNGTIWEKVDRIDQKNCGQYWVSTLYGNDTTGDGGINAPFKTIQKAINVGTALFTSIDIILDSTVGDGGISEAISIPGAKSVAISGLGGVATYWQPISDVTLHDGCIFFANNVQMDRIIGTPLTGPGTYVVLEESQLTSAAVNDAFVTYWLFGTIGENYLGSVLKQGFGFTTGGVGPLKMQLYDELNMKSNKILNVANGAAASDALNVGQLSTHAGLPNVHHNQSHAIGGADHSTSTLANLNSKISDLIATYGGIRDIGIGTLVQRPAFGTANRFFYTTDENLLYRDTGAAWTPLGAYDKYAIHTNQPGEINSIASKNPVVDNDLLVIEDSAALFVKNKVLMSNLKTYVNGYTVGTTRIVREIPVCRIAATGGLLNVNVLAYTSIGYFDVPFNKADWVFSPFATKRIKLKVRGKVQNAGQTCNLTVFQANDQKAAFVEVAGASVQYDTDTNWHVRLGADFWAALNAGDIILRFYGKSSTVNVAQCGQLDTSDELFLVIEEVA